MSTPEPLFPLAVLRGVIEHGDPGRHFGSTLGLRDWCEEAARLGWIRQKMGQWVGTLEGHRIYSERNLAKYPPGRAYFWDEEARERAGREG